MINSIYHSIEHWCWARDFDHKEYLWQHADRKLTTATMSESSYKRLCAIFEDDMELHFATQHATTDKEVT